MFGEFNPRETVQNITQYIKERVSKPALVGLSGGIDSSLTCSLTAKALGPRYVKALTMQNERYSDDSLQRAKAIGEQLGIKVETVHSEPARNGLEKSLPTDQVSKSQHATLDARICDTILRTVAMQENRMYIGTINGTERLTGWYPKGALVGDLCPIGGVLKHQAQELATYFDLESLTKTIADDAAKICSGCGRFEPFQGIPYETLDHVLYIWETASEDPSWQEFESIEEEHAETIIQRVKATRHKRDTFPPYYEVNTWKD